MSPWSDSESIIKLSVTVVVSHTMPQVSLEVCGMYIPSLNCFGHFLNAVLHYLYVCMYVYVLVVLGL